MAESDTTSLDVARREPEGSRATRRLRRSGQVPGVVYGGGDEPITFQVDARLLRQALAHGGAVIDLNVEGEGAQPVVVKEEQHDPVTGRLLHLDLLRVRLDKPIQATTILDLVGAEDAPGVKEGGVLEQITRELNIEALPTNIPDTIEHDVSAMEMNHTLTLAAITAPAGVTLLDDAEDTVIATLSPPRVEEEPEEEIEEETELVGEEGEVPEGEGEAPAEGAEGGGERGESEGDAGGE
jgi:large subunit ribosomal protein L25